MADCIPVKINAFPTLTDGQVDDNTKLVGLGIASTGKMYSGTVEQLKKIFSTQKFKYVATGSEGTTLTIATIAGKYILAIFREGMAMYEVSSSPDSTEFIWNSTTITLGLAANPGERFLILYKNI